MFRRGGEDRATGGAARAAVRHSGPRDAPGLQTGAGGYGGSVMPSATLTIELLALEFDQGLASRGKRPGDKQACLRSG